MSLQLSHSETNNPLRTFPLVLVCDGVQSPSNIGSIFRICDSMGVSKVIFCNAEINFNSPRLQKTARNTQLQVPYSDTLETVSEIQKLKEKGFTIIALEITNDSILIKNIPISENQKIALIIGNEQQGVSQKVLEQCDVSTHIAMFGKNSSMNVVQATSIALYTLINKLYIY